MLSHHPYMLLYWKWRSIRITPCFLVVFEHTIFRDRENWVQGLRVFYSLKEYQNTQVSTVLDPQTFPRETKVWNTPPTLETVPSLVIKPTTIHQRHVIGSRDINRSRGPAILSFRTTLPFLFTPSPTRRVVKHRHFDWTTSKFLGHVDASLWSDIRGWWGHRVRGSDRLANRTPPPLISGACDVRLTRWDLVYTPDASPTSLPLFLPSFQQAGLRSTEWMFPPKSMDTSNAKLNYICRLSIGKG